MLYFGGNQIRKLYRGDTPIKKMYYGEVTVIPAAFSPADLNPALWLDAADADSIVLDGGVVSEWTNKGSIPLSPSQGNAANRPSVIAGELNGKSVIRFTTSPDTYLGITEGLGLNMSSVYDATGSTVFILKKYVSGVVEFNMQSGTGNRIGFEGGNRIDMPNDSAGKIVGDSTTNTWVCMLGRRETTKERLYYNGNLAGEVSNTNMFAAQSAVLGVGALHNGGNSSRVDMAEIIIYPRDLSVAEINQVQTYLQDKWAVAQAHLPVDPPVLESFGVGTSSSGVTSHTTAAPSGIQDGELLIHIASLKNDNVGLATYTPPAGFIEIGTPVNSSATNLRLSAKIADNESGDYNWMTGALTQSASQMWRVSGHGGVEGLQIAFTASPARNMSNTSPSIDVAAANSLGVRACARERGGGEAITCPPTLVAVNYSVLGTGLSEMTLGTSQEVFDEAEASGTAEFSWSTNECYSVCATIIIPPA